MRKTGSEIETDVYGIITSSAIKTSINGAIYKSGTRPLNSLKEDAVVSFMTGLDGQKQTGVVTVNIYVPDIDNGSGMLLKNASRCKALEIMANGIVQGLVPGEYRYGLGAIVQTFPAGDIKQHFVNVKIKFELATF